MRRRSLDSIPAPARQTILREAHGAPVTSVEIEKKNGKALYEAHVKQGDDVIGILVDAVGKLVGKHSEKDERNTSTTTSECSVGKLGCRRTSRTELSLFRCGPLNPSCPFAAST